MRNWFKREHYVEIEPGTLPVAADATRLQKIRTAIAKLGKKWVLSDTREAQIESYKNGEDLV